MSLLHPVKNATMVQNAFIIFKRISCSSFISITFFEPVFFQEHSWVPFPVILPGEAFQSHNLCKLISMLSNFRSKLHSTTLSDILIQILVLSSVPTKSDYWILLCSPFRLHSRNWVLPADDLMLQLYFLRYLHTPPALIATSQSRRYFGHKNY